MGARCCCNRGLPVGAAEKEVRRYNAAREQKALTFNSWTRWLLYSNVPQISARQVLVLIGADGARGVGACSSVAAPAGGPSVPALASSEDKEPAASASPSAAGAFGAARAGAVDSGPVGAGPSPEVPPVLVDCRTDAERLVSTIPGAVSQQSLLDSLAVGTETKKGSPPPTLAGRAHPRIVCFCTVGMRSGLFAKRLLRDHPELDVFNMDGALVAWLHQGGQVVTPEGVPTTTVHTFSWFFAWEPHHMTHVTW